MSDWLFETLDGLFKTIHKQGRRIEELETRLCELERRLREMPVERDSESSRPVLELVGTVRSEGD